MASRDTLQEAASGFTEVKFQRALDRKQLKKAPPAFVQGNRSQAEKVFNEDELNQNARIWFQEFEDQIRFYEKLGHDLEWVLDWTKKWWWSWLVRDWPVIRSLCTEDVRYKDPVSFGKEMVGVQEFIDYNVAFFDAIPDWRYDPLPGETFLQVNPDGTVQMMVRYLGSGHWDGPLKVYPFDETAQALPGNGTFMQCPAVDRYYWNADGVLYKGETLWDAFEAVQASGIFPKAGSVPFNLLMGSLKVPNAASRLIKRLPGRG